MKLTHLAQKSYATAQSLAVAMYGERWQHMKRNEFFARANRLNIEVPEMESVETIDNYVAVINRQVKDASCPNNRRNNFYKWKHRYIKKQMQLGNVEKVLESEKLYHFYLCSGHDFHQLKNSFKDSIAVDGTEEYIPEPKDAPFNEDEFKKTIVQMMLFLINK